MLQKFSPTLVVCLFHTCYFYITRSFNFNVVKFFKFFLYNFKEIFANIFQDHEDTFPILTSTTVLLFIFKAKINLKLIFMYGMRQRDSRFIFPHIYIKSPVDTTTFIENSFPIALQFYLSLKWVAIICEDLFMNSCVPLL